MTQVVTLTEELEAQFFKFLKRLEDASEHQSYEKL
jgi:hypothetical protein